MLITQDNTVLITLLIAAIGLLVTTCEYIVYHAFATDKLLPTLIRGNVLTKFSETLLGKYKTNSLLIWSSYLRLLFLVFLIAAIFTLNSLIPYFLLLIVLLNLVIMLFKQVGNDGADQMSNIIFISLLFYFTASNAITQIICILFIVGQSLLSYFTAGLAKARSPIWMKSNAVGNILGCLAYGDEKAYAFLKKHASIGIWLSKVVVVFELIFPVSILLPSEFCIIILILAAVFHINCGIWMGLNDFTWAFISAYPLIYWTSLQI